MAVEISGDNSLEWDASFKNNDDPSGRSVMSVHLEGYEKK